MENLLVKYFVIEKDFEIGYSKEVGDHIPISSPL